MVFLGKQAHANAILDPAAAPFALVGTAAGNRHHRQGGCACSRRIAGDTGQTGIHHIFDSRNGKGGFGHIGGHNDLTLRRARKDPGLLGGCQSGVQGQDPRFFEF